MKASEIVKRARGIAAIENSSFINYDDESSSLNESWKDVYAYLTDSSDDYFVKEEELTDRTELDEYEYEYELPTDFFKLRTVDYKDGTQSDWKPADKFNLNNRNYNTLGVMYRFKQNKLWVLGNPTQVRISYYPAPDFITHPAPGSYEFEFSVDETADIAEHWCAKNQTSLIQAQDNLIVRWDENSETSTILYDGATDAVYPMVYKNKIFFIDSGEIFRLDLDGSVTSLDTDVVTSFRPSLVGDVLYYNTVTGLTSIDLVTGTTTAFAVAYDCYYTDGLKEYYIDGGDLEVDGTVLVSGGVTYFSYPFYTQRSVIYSLDADDNSTIWRDGYDGGHAGNEWMIIADPDTGSLSTIGSQIDYNFDYPQNIVPEIMSFSMAVDFKIKSEADPGVIKARLNELWTRFNSTVNRDSYEVQSIKNVYSGRVY